MKKIYLIIVLFSLFSCRAQIIPLKNAYVDIPNGAYLKDTDNFLDNFIGTWKYQNGNEQFIIEFKKVLHYNYDTYFKDILVGEYKYIDNSGMIIINTLPNINATIDPLYHKIDGAIFKVQMEYPPCQDCNANEYRVKVSFDDPDRDYIPMALLLRSISSTQIKVKLMPNGKPRMYNKTENDPMDIRVPSGEYLMTRI